VVVDANRFSVKTDLDSHIIPASGSNHIWDNPPSPNPTNLPRVGQHTCQFKVKLTDARYPAVSLQNSSTQVKVRISACIITSFVLDPSLTMPETNSFAILTATPNAVYGLKTYIQAPLCGYPEVLTASYTKNIHAPAPYEYNASAPTTTRYKRTELLASTPFTQDGATATKYNSNNNCVTLQIGC